MPVKSFIRYADQIAIESRLPDSCLVPTHQQNGLALLIKGKGNTPCSPIGIETQLLHPGVTRTVESIHIRPSKLRSIFTEDYCRSFQLFPNRMGKLANLYGELLVKLHHPTRLHIMLWNA